MFLLAPFCLTGSDGACRAEWCFRLKSCGQRACWQEVKWITLCMYKYVNSACVYYPWRGCITHLGPAPNCISWLLCSYCWCHTMKQVWMLVFRVIFSPPNPEKGLFHLQRIAQMHLVGFAGGRIRWRNLRRETKCGEFKISCWNWIFGDSRGSHFEPNYRVHSVTLWPLLTVWWLSAFLPSGFRTAPSAALKIPEPWKAETVLSGKASEDVCLSARVRHPSLPSTQLD